EVLQRLAVGLHGIVNEHAGLRCEAILGHQMKLDAEVSEGPKCVEEHQSALALQISADKEDFDWPIVQSASRWPAPFGDVHSRRDDVYLFGRYSVALDETALRPLRPNDQSPCRPEAIAV